MSLSKIKKVNTNLNVIGVMSGSSLDGLDMALCQFYYKQRKIQYKILEAKTLPYPRRILNILSNIRNSSAKDFFEYDVIYGRWVGNKILRWIKNNKLKAHAISIHGHTVFHYPEKGFSVQLANPFQISAICGIPVIHNFRNADIALGGQGAPLVPVGDKLLFHQYDACVNIGGIANVFIHKTNIAFDICIANIALNYFSQQINKNFDRNGMIAQQGNIHQQLFKELNQLKFVRQKPPKSLNREYFENSYLQVIQKYTLSVYDIIATLTEHIAIQIAKSVSAPYLKNILITGGGAFNIFLIQRIISHAGKNKNFVIPDKTTVKYKEALIFALLGYLKLLNLPNTISAATGARKNTSCGEIVHI